MDKTVPAGAALLLDLIYRTETGLERPACYEVIFGHNQNKLPKPLTSMTLDEIEKAQASWTKRFGSSAMGAGQFMRNTLDAPGTLRDIEGEMGLTGREKATPDLQDRMAYHLLKRRGFEAFMAAETTRTEFGKRLSMEWASFPVLADTKGRHRAVKRGQSYYAGDGLNKALIAPEVVEATLNEVFALSGLGAPTEAQPLPDVPKPVPAPVPPQAPSWLRGASLLTFAALVGAAVWMLQHSGAPVPDEPEYLIPHPKPFAFVGSQELWATIALNLALPFLAPLAAAVAAWIVGQVSFWWARWFKVEFDAKSAADLQGALVRGILLLAQGAFDRNGRLKIPAADRQSLLSGAADYAVQFQPDKVKHFKLSHEELMTLAAPHLAAFEAGIEPVLPRARRAER